MSVPNTSEVADRIRIKHKLLSEPPVAVSSRVLLNRHNEVIADASEAETSADFVDGLGGVTVDRLSLASPVQNVKGLNAAFDAFMRLNTQSIADPVHVAITGFGDSMCNVGLTLMMDLAQKYGVGALYTPNFGVSWNGASATLSGGAEYVTADLAKTPRTSAYDFSAVPSSPEVNLPSGGQYALTTPDFATNPDIMVYIPGGSITEARITTAQNRISLPQGIKSVRVFYRKAPGAGSVTATLEQSLLSNVSSTVSADAASALGTIDLTVTDRFAPITLKVSAATAAVRFIGAAFLTGSGGVSYWSSAQGSTEMGQQLTGLVNGVWNPIYKAIATSLGTGLVFHAQRATEAGDEANNFKKNYLAFFAAYTEAGYSQLIFTEPHRGTENALSSVDVNTWLIATANELGLAVYDRRSMVDEVVADALGWPNGDLVHRGYRENRFTMGGVSALFWNFRSAFGALTPTLNAAGLDAMRVPAGAVDLCARTILSGRNGITLDGAAQSTYSAASVDSERGFKFASTAALGHAAARLGVTPGGSANLEMGTWDFTFTGVGYRNVNLPAGVEAWLVFGGNATTLTSVASLAQKCFGLQFAYGSDIGGLGGTTTQEFVRIFYCNGSTTTYGKWISLVMSGQAVASGGGVRFILTWTKSNQLFTLWTSNNEGVIRPRTTLACSFFASTNTAGSWVHGGIRAANTDWGNGASGTPATTGLFQWRDITAQFTPPQP